MAPPPPYVAKETSDLNSSSFLAPTKLLSYQTNCMLATNIVIIPPDPSDQKISCLLRSPFFDLSNHLHGSHPLCIPWRPKQQAGISIFENRQVVEMLNKKAACLPKSKNCRTPRNKAVQLLEIITIPRIHGKTVSANENSRKVSAKLKIELFL